MMAFNPTESRAASAKQPFTTQQAQRRARHRQGRAAYGGGKGAILDRAARCAYVAGRDEGMAIAVEQANRTLKKNEIEAFGGSRHQPS
jgi:hypothetical protein